MSNKITRDFRFVKRKDRRGRAYFVDKTTGKRSSRIAWQEERQAVKAEQVRKKQEARLRRSEAAKAAWDRRREREAIREEPKAIPTNTNIKPPSSPKRPWMVEEVGDGFIPIEKMPETFLEGLGDKAKKFKKVERAAKMALAFAAAEREHILDLDKVKEDEYVRIRMFHAWESMIEKGIIDLKAMNNIDVEAPKIAQELEIPIREVYALFFSPEVA